MRRASSRTLAGMSIITRGGIAGAQGYRPSRCRLRAKSVYEEEAAMVPTQRSPLRVSFEGSLRKTESV